MPSQTNTLPAPRSELWFTKVATVADLKALLAQLPDTMQLGRRGHDGNGGSMGLRLTTRVPLTALSKSLRRRHDQMYFAGTPFSCDNFGDTHTTERVLVIED